LYSFQIDDEQGIAAIMLDSEMNGKSIDIIIKDLKINKMMPVLLTNTNGEVAFDKSSGIYYT